MSAGDDAVVELDAGTWTCAPGPAGGVALFSNTTLVGAGFLAGTVMSPADIVTEVNCTLSGRHFSIIGATNVTIAGLRLVSGKVVGGMFSVGGWLHCWAGKPLPWWVMGLFTRSNENGFTWRYVLSGWVVAMLGRKPLPWWVMGLFTRSNEHGFTDGGLELGSAIALEAADLVLDTVEISDCTSNWDGTVSAISGSSLHVFNSVFKRNHAR